MAKKKEKFTPSYLFTDDRGTEVWVLVGNKGRFRRKNGIVEYFKSAEAAEAVK